ncbi:MAG: restriction endonuclease subunit S [Saprospiraceae bacterium]
MKAQAQSLEKQNIKSSNTWRMLTLGEVGDIVSGGTPSTAVKEYWGGKINWISPSDLTGYKKKTIIKGAKSITELGLKNSSARMMPKGSVLFSSRAPIGYVVIAAEDLSTNQGFKSIIPHDFVSSEYLYYFLSASKQAAEKVASGTTFKEISKATFAELKIPIPDLVTQQAIVSKIEELFSELDKGIESLKLAQQKLKVYRQAVLKWAFEGRLTNENVEEEELPKGWKWVQSGTLFDFVTSGSRGWAKYYSDSGSIFIRITNLDFDSLALDLEESKIQYVKPPMNSEGTRTKIQEGDFLISITGYLGMFAIAPKMTSAYINQHISLCRPTKDINRKYLGYWIISKSGGHKFLNKMTKGATKAGLGLNDIKSFPVPIAPIEQQEIIVQAIENRLSVIDKMGESINQSLQQAEVMRQSILKRAFDGDLNLD